MNQAHRHRAFMPSSSRIGGFVVALAVALLHAGLAHSSDDQVDFDRYAQLASEARSAHERLSTASPDEVDSLLEAARDADRAVIDWLEAFMETEQYQSLPNNQRELVLQDRDRTAYNLATVFLTQRRCDEADEYVTLAQRTVVDSALRRLLEEAQQQVQSCLEAQRFVTLVVDCSPPSASLLIDGRPLGSAAQRHQVTREPHSLTIEAAGYNSQTLALQLDTTENVVRIGPIALLAVEEAAPHNPRMPHWYSWTLWGVGAVGISTGIGYIVAASNREQDLDDIESSGGIILDPEAERGIVDNMRTGGIVSLTVGVVAAAVGTVLYILDRRPASTSEENDTAWQITGDGFVLTW